MKQAAWSKNKPAANGFYWVCFEEHHRPELNIVPVEVLFVQAGWYMLFIGHDRTVSVDHFTEEAKNVWWMKLEKPAAPKDGGKA